MTVSIILGTLEEVKQLEIDILKYYDTVSGSCNSFLYKNKIRERLLEKIREYEPNYNPNYDRPDSTAR